MFSLNFMYKFKLYLATLKDKIKIGRKTRPFMNRR